MGEKLDLLCNRWVQAILCYFILNQILLPALLNDGCGTLNDHLGQLMCQMRRAQGLFLCEP